MAQKYGDRWVVQESIREGGQAHTFIVTDSRGSGKDQYVLKRLKNPQRVSRFKIEIEAIRNLSHDNVLRLIDFDLEAEKPYLVTEFCKGGSLSECRRFWQDSPVQALKLFQGICAGVAFAHSQGIIHRDIKPDNIFLRELSGPPVVGDFGICLLEKTDDRMTLTEEAVGPRLYMAPEVEDGRLDKITPQVDSYSLGKLLYWLLSGGKIFSREKHREREWDLKGRNEDSILGWNNIYMEHVNRLLDKMIIENPNDRLIVDTALILTRRVTRLVEKEYNPVDQNIRQLCTYCGEGYYVQKVKSNPMQVHNFGLNAVGSSDWRIYTCIECGHVQAFRADLAKRIDRWANNDRR